MAQLLPRIVVGPPKKIFAETAPGGYQVERAERTPAKQITTAEMGDHAALVMIFSSVTWVADALMHFRSCYQANQSQRSCLLAN